MYYKNLYKKEMIKNVIIIGIILFIAIFSTYHIYYSFGETKEVDFSSTSLDISFHEDNGEELNITKVVSKTDSVGLSSAGHKITITNNLTEDVNYKIKIVDNEEKLEETDCQGLIIPKEEIRVSIKESGKETKIYSLSELEDGVILTTTAKALEKDKYTIRIWIKEDTLLPNGSKYHYHGLIQVIENETTLAVR
jgi:archaellum component FlaF (FlaF/FlaG flagellin family)